MGVTLKAMLERQSWKIPFFSLFQGIGQSICLKNQVVNFRVRWPISFISSVSIVPMVNSVAFRFPAHIDRDWIPRKLAGKYPPDFRM